MHDVLVFPSPASENDFKRWDDAGWDPELLAVRVTQLGDAAVTIPWDHQLRDVWKRAYDNLTEEQRENPATAYILTAEQLADLSFVTLMGSEDDRFEQVALNPPTIHPAFAGADGRLRIKKENAELIAAYAGSDSVTFTGSSGSTDLTHLQFDWPTASPGYRLQLQLATPDEPDEGTFHRVLELIGDDDFQLARRRLWSWESQLPESCSPEDVSMLIEALVADYNRAVDTEMRRTRLQTVFLLVPAAVGIGIDQAFGGWASTIVGAAAGIAIDKIKARFPTVSGRAARASHHPGSAVSGMLSVVGHG